MPCASPARSNPRSGIWEDGMRFVIVGKHDPGEMDKPLKRRDVTRAVLEKLGAKREFGGYLLGR